MEAIIEAKLAVAKFAGLENDALHIYVAIIVYLGACFVFRWKAWSVKPWLVVLIFAITGEWVDIRAIAAADDPVNLDESRKDIWNTMLVPTIVLLSARFTRVFARPETSQTPEKD